MCTKFRMLLSVCWGHWIVDLLWQCLYRT